MHDLNNILATIDGYSQLLKQTLKEKKQQSYCDIIRTGISELSEMTEQICTLATGKYNHGVEKEEINLMSFFASLAAMVSARCHIKLNMGESSVAWADPKLLEMVVISLIKICEEELDKHADGQVSLSYRSEERYVTIRISDNRFTGGAANHEDQTGSDAYDAIALRQVETLYAPSQIIRSLGGKLWFDLKEDTGINYYIHLPGRKVPENQPDYQPTPSNR
jgi:light-regulated signal transduction histidine kinase (bacteriophytochrome)